MDPDDPQPSIESDELPATQIAPAKAHMPLQVDTTAPQYIPLPPSSPMKSPYTKTRSPARMSSPQKSVSSPSSTSSQNERQTTPSLQTRRSTSNLNISRNGTPSKPQYRRLSSNLNPASPVGSTKAPAVPEVPQRKVLSPSDVAKDYFEQDLARHSTCNTTVTVIVHDSCYGHRFSRPKTSKAALSTIVERPERIHATVLGASTAYVQLGGRHADGRHPPHPQKHPPVESIPFQIRKTSRYMPLNSPCVTQVHGSRWMDELQIMCDSAESKLAMNGRELARPIGYGKDENGYALPKLHEGDLYLCAESLSALQGCLGGVCDAVDTIFDESPTQRAFVCIRPPGHHCSSNYPSGFCWLNNVHVGLTYGAMNYGLTHAAIIDFDLHHGDGSQAIAWSHNRKAQTLKPKDAAHKKTPIGYYSLHDINSYPCEWGDEEKVRNASVCMDAHGHSIWNVHLEPWKDHKDFWRLYESRYVVILDKARRFLRHHTEKFRAQGSRPRAAIFLSAGFDASEWEGAGMQRHAVNVPTDFYARFTADVVKMSQEEDLGVEGRVISVLEGGYSDRALTSGVLSHLCGLVDKPANSTSLDTPNLEASSDALNTDSTVTDVKNDSRVHYDTKWWDQQSLETIEAIVAGNLPPPPKPNDKAPGDYASPTQASSARMTEVARERRSLSAQLEARLYMENKPLPPPPDVDWAVAAYEVSRLIIPAGRQTLSCRPDELNAEATKARRERQSTVGFAAGSSGEPMQLRERRAKAVPLPAAALKSSARNDNRRTTIASVSDLPDPSMGDTRTHANSRLRRRSSAASSIVSSFKDMQLDDSEEQTKPTRRSRSGTRTPTRAIEFPNPKQVTAVKKPKSTPSKPAPKRRTSPRRISPRREAARPVLSRPPSVTSDRTNGTGKTSSAKSQSQSNSLGNDVSASSQNGLENITNGVKKISIKLNVPSAEEGTAKQKKTVTDQPKKTTTLKKPAVPRVSKPKPAIKLPQASANVKPDVHPVRVEASSKPNADRSSTSPKPEFGSDHAPSVHDTNDDPPVSPQQVMSISSAINGSEALPHQATMLPPHAPSRAPAPPEPATVHSPPLPTSNVPEAHSQSPPSQTEIFSAQLPSRSRERKSTSSAGPRRYRHVGTT